MDAILITAWDALVNMFLPIFTQPTGCIFTRLLTGWILCAGRRTVTGMIRGGDPDGHRAHDAYHRFFPDAAWAMQDLWQRLVLVLVQRFYPQGTVVVDLDDTLFHRSGRKVKGAGWWRDAVRSTGATIVYAWGLNIVVLTLRVHPPWGGEPLGLPINMRLHHKQGPTRIELAEQMLRQLSEWLPERRFRARVLRLPGRQKPCGHSYHQPHATRCGDLRSAAHSKKKDTGPTENAWTKTPATATNGRLCSSLEDGDDLRTRPHPQTIDLCPKGAVVSCLQTTGAAGHQPRPDGQRKRQLFLYHRSDNEASRGDQPLRRPLVHRGHLQKHQTTAGRPTAADLDTSRPRTGRGPELVVVLDGMAVVPATKASSAYFHRLAVVCPQDNAQLCRCLEQPASRALADPNKIHVR